jgi:hypothetical protein
MVGQSEILANQRQLGKRVKHRGSVWQHSGREWPVVLLPHRMKPGSVGAHQRLSFVAKASYHTGTTRSSDPTFLNVELRQTLIEQEDLPWPLRTIRLNEVELILPLKLRFTSAWRFCCVLAHFATIRAAADVGHHHCSCRISKFQAPASRARRSRNVGGGNLRAGIVDPSDCSSGVARWNIGGRRANDGNSLSGGPPPTARVEHWPIIGAPVNNNGAAPQRTLGRRSGVLRPQIKAVMPSEFTASAGFGFTRLQFLFSILVAGALLAKAQAAYEVTCLLAKRRFGKKGPEFQHLMGATIRSVTTGILGVAFIQSVLAGLGFLVVGLPGAGLWALVFLIAAVLQVGMLVLIPAVAYVFAVSSMTKAVIFLIGVRLSA